MAGIMNKVGDKLNVGGNKEGERKPEHHGDQHMPQHHGESKPQYVGGEQHKPEEHKEGFMDKVKHHGESKPQHCGGEQHKPGQQQEGFMDKIKDKVHGGEGHDDKGEKFI